jgi:hypothetical protein
MARAQIATTVQPVQLFQNQAKANAKDFTLPSTGDKYSKHSSRPKSTGL